MSWIRRLVDRPPLAARVLFWYWLASAAALGLFVLVVAAGTGTSWTDVMQDPYGAVGLAQAFVSVIMAVLLRAVGTGPRLNGFSWFVLVQQLVIGNLVGFLLAVVLVLACRRTPVRDEALSLSPLVLWPAGILVLLASLLVLVAQTNSVL